MQTTHSALIRVGVRERASEVGWMNAVTGGVLEGKQGIGMLQGRPRTSAASREEA